MDGILDEILKALGAAIAAGLVGIVVQLFRRIGISIEAEQQAKLELLVKDGIKRAEEWGRSRIQPPASEDKLAVAVSHVASQMPKVPLERIEQTIQAKLADVGAGATVPKS